MKQINASDLTVGLIELEANMTPTQPIFFTVGLRPTMPMGKFIEPLTLVYGLEKHGKSSKAGWGRTDMYEHTCCSKKLFSSEKRACR